MIATALTGGDLNVTNCDPHHLTAILQKLAETGVQTSVKTDSVRVMGDHPLQAADLKTEEFPGLPDDMEAADTARPPGRKDFHRRWGRNRFMHAGTCPAWSEHQDRATRAIVRGKTPLSAAAVLASDLRASASLVLAALVADGETIIDRVDHLDRGYEHIEEKLKAVGAEIRRVGDMFPKRTTAPTAG